MHFIIFSYELLFLLIASQHGGYTLSNRAGSQQDLQACLHLGMTDYRSPSLPLVCMGMAFNFSS